MYFDFFTAAALVDELNERLAGGRIQAVIPIDSLSLGFEIYSQRTRHYLYISAEPEQPRLHLVDEKLRRGYVAASPLLLLLKRHVDGGQILGVRQPPWERIVIFDIASSEGDYSLIVEPMERRANILLVEDGIIKECMRRVKADENRYRQLLPGHEYLPPPQQEKQEPQTVTLADITHYLAENTGDKAIQALTRGILGISPLLAREIIFRAAGDINAKAGDVDPGAVFSAFGDVLPPLLDHQWQPGTCVDDDEVTAFAIYPVTHRAGWTDASSVSEALVAFYGALTGDHAYEAGKRPIREQIDGAQKKLNSKLYNLQNQERDDAEVERLRQSGELLLAYQHQIEKGQQVFEAQYDPEGEPLTIKLDPLKTAVDNAQRYFDKYDKAKRSRQSLPDLILHTEREIRYLKQLDSDLQMAANWDEIGEVQEALQEGGYWKGTHRKRVTGGGKSAPLKVIAQDGTLIWVGRNSRQNEEVTFKKGDSSDIWLHARGMPGAHVIIKTGGREASDALLDEAASLAAFYSPARDSNAVEVMVAERKNVRKIKGGKPGMVRVSSYTMVNAVPRREEIE
jgi:predicted ribosome quality control (RQC) complex YloA/Tae2 family protein